MTMKRGHYVLAAGVATAGAAALAATAYLKRKRHEEEMAAPLPRTAVEVFDGSNTEALPPIAMGRAEPDDPLGGPEHALPGSVAQETRYRAKLGPGGKATSREREQMYQAPEDGSAGSMGNTLGREDQVPIGRIKS